MNLNRKPQLTSEQVRRCVKRLRPLMPVVMGLFLFSTPAVGQGGDVLVWSSGNSGGDTAGVAADIDSFGYFNRVVGMDDPTTPPLSDLIQYDAILFFSNLPGGDMVEIGDVLADYADTGRRLVMATFSWANQNGNTLGGRIITDEISPLLVDGITLYTDVSLASDDGSIFFDGVSSVQGHYHDDVKLSTNAVSHGTWDDGETIVASKANVVGINLFPDDFYGKIGGDYLQLFANSLKGLSLGVNLTKADAGDTLAFRTGPGEPSQLSLLMTQDINGSFFSYLIDIGPFDAAGARNYSAVIPAGLAGLDITFQAFGYGQFGALEATNRVLVSFQ